MLGERTSQSRKDKKKVNPVFLMGSGLKLYHSKGSKTIVFLSLCQMCCCIICHVEPSHGKNVGE